MNIFLQGFDYPQEQAIESYYQIYCDLLRRYLAEPNVEERDATLAAIAARYPSLTQEQWIDLHHQALAQLLDDMPDVIHAAELKHIGECLQASLAVHTQQEENLAYHKAALSQLTAQIANCFINVSEQRLNQSIELALQKVGEAVGAEQSYVLKYSDDSTTVSMTHEWVADGYESRASILQNVPVCEFPHTIRHLLHAGKPLHIPDVQGLEHESERVSYSAVGIQSVLAFPLRDRDRTFGAVGFACLNRPRYWIPEEFELLQLVGQTVANVLLRHQAEEALRQSEERWQLALSGSRDGIWDWDIQNQVFVRSKRWLQMLGYEVDDSQNPMEGVLEGGQPGEMSWIKFLHPDDRARAIATQQAYLNREIPHYSAEYRFRCQDGSYRWILSRGQAVWDENGKPIRMVGFHTDISDRKQAELELQQKTRELEKTFEVLPDLCFRIDAHGTYLDYYGTNPDKMFAAPDDMIGRNIREVVPPDLSANLFLNGIQRSLTEQTVVTCEYSTVLHGKQWHFESRIVPYDVDQVIVVVRDVTEQRQAEAALRRSETTLRAVFEAMPDLLMRYDVQGRYLGFFMGGSQVDVIPLPASTTDATVFDLLPAEAAQQRLEAIQVAVCTQTMQAYEQVLQHDGRTRYEEVRVVPIEGDETLVVVRDVTRQKQTERKLRDSEEKFRQIAENIRQVLYIRSADFSQFHYVNPAYQTLFGYPVEHLYSDPHAWYESLHPADRNEVLAVMQATPPDQTIEIEFRILDANKDVRWVHISRFPICNADGQVDRIVGVISDITDRKRAELSMQEWNQHLEILVEYRTKKLRQSREAIAQQSREYRTLMDNIPYSICRFDCNLRHTYINRHTEMVTDLTPQSMLGKTVAELGLLDAEVRPFITKLRRARDLGEVQEHVALWTLPEGQRWIETRLVPEFNSAGAVTSILEVSGDITQRMHMEQELRDSQRFAQSLAEAAPYILYVYDLDQRHATYVNPQVKTILGYDVEQVQQVAGSALTQFIHPQDLERGAAHLQQLTQSQDGDVYEIEFRVRRADGNWCWLQSRNVVFRRTPEGAIAQILGTAQDITERKQTEQQLRLSLAEKEVLLREVYHRVKNNLNVIYSLLNMQLQTIQDRQVRSVLEDSQKRIQSMALIHEQLYQSESLAEIDFTEYVQRLVNNVAASSIGASRIQIHLDIAPVQLDLQVAIPLGLIINELVVNAFKHAFPQQQSGSIWVELCDRAENQLTLIVRDDGVGMPQDLDWKTQSSLGIRLVNILAQQLRAEVLTAVETGTQFQLNFSLPEAAGNTSSN
jgi:hypothetical protein